MSERLRRQGQQERDELSEEILNTASGKYVPFRVGVKAAICFCLYAIALLCAFSQDCSV